jgi:signal transduction histidine kinase
MVGRPVDSKDGAVSVEASAMRRIDHEASPPRVPAPTQPEAALDSDAPPEDGRTVAETLSRRLHRLALDVHDGPMQNLAVIGFSLGDLRRRMRAVLPPEDQPKIDAGLEQITDELGRVESDLRALIGALEDGVRTRVPLREAIESEIRAFKDRCETEVAFVFDGSARADTDSQRIALQSVTRAALANVAKHSGASQVTVRLGGSAELTTLEIEDNGRGFASDLSPKPGRFGLSGMRRRVELLGGEFAVASRPGGPTVVRASLRPWHPERD